MIEFLTPLLFVVMLGIIGGQALLQHLERQTWHQQQEKFITAFLSKNAGEYAHAVKTEKEAPEVQKNPDEVDLSTASEEVFDKFIKNQSS